MTQVQEFTDAQASRLAEFLSAPERPAGTMSYCELSGFLFAVACSPELVQPSEWLPLIFNEDEGGFKTQVQAKEILPAILALYNHVRHGVLEGEPEFPPGCAVRAEPMSNFEPDAALNQWTHGFWGGHDWLENVWEQYAPEEVGEELGIDLLVLTTFASRELAEDYRKELEGEPASLEEFAKEMLQALPEAMQSYAGLGRALYEAAQAESTEHKQKPARNTKTGRNEPCPCGSGRKYKQCCGAGRH